MSRHHYETGKTIQHLKLEADLPYYGIVQGLMRLSDSTNLAKLRAVFPEVYADLVARYNAPGGVLPGDPPWPFDGSGKRIDEIDGEEE